jgi:hypothetical protein
MSTAAKLKTLKEHGELQPGTFYTFAYQSNKSKSTKEGQLVRIGVKDWAQTIWDLSSKAKDRLARQEEQAKDLRPYWQSVVWANDIIDKTTAKKKENKIRLWEDFESEFPADFANYEKAKAIIEQTKTTLNEKIQKEDRDEKIDPISFFFRQYDLEKEIDPKESYLVEAGYIGKSIDLRNGRDRHLFLVKEATITVEQWLTVKDDPRVVILEEIDTDK